MMGSFFIACSKKQKKMSNIIYTGLKKSESGRKSYENFIKNNKYKTWENYEKKISIIIYYGSNDNRLSWMW